MLGLSKKKAGYQALMAALMLGVVTLRLRCAAAVPVGEWGVTERLLCLLNSGLSACGMEYYARYAHKSSWHGSMWLVHRTHHTAKSETDVFELNDMFGVLNVLLILPVMIWAWFQPVSLGTAGLLGFTVGISCFGTAYIVVHDGIHHRRFPVGWLDQITWLKEIADAHGEHHKAAMAEPYGMFLGPQELQAAKEGREVAPMPQWMRWSLVATSSGTCAALIGIV